MKELTIFDFQITSHRIFVNETNGIYMILQEFDYHLEEKEL